MTALAPSRTTRATRAMAAALIVTGVVIGLPWLLITFAGAPWTWHLPSIQRLSVALSWPPSTNTVKYALAIAGWAIWIGLVIRLTREIVAQLSGRRSASQVRGPIRLLAATLVGGVTATAPALAASAEPTTVVTAPAEQCQTETPQTPNQDPAADAETTPADHYERDAEGNIIHTVERGDNLWDLASKYYQDPLRHQEIFEACRARGNAPRWSAPLDFPVPSGAAFSVVSRRRTRTVRSSISSHRRTVRRPRRPSARYAALTGT